MISWALALASPVFLPLAGWAAWRHGLDAPAEAWLGFVYVSLISQYAAFFAWYAGLAAGGVAKVGQLQLLQPFLTLAAAALLLGERLTLSTLAFAAVVVAIVALGRKMPVR